MDILGAYHWPEFEQQIVVKKDFRDLESALAEKDSRALLYSTRPASTSSSPRFKVKSKQIGLPL